MEKKVCSKCGLELEKGYLFCKNCGTRVVNEEKINKEEKVSPKEKVCQKCHNVLKPNELFCSKCGSKFLDDKKVKDVDVKTLKEKPKENKNEVIETKNKEKRCFKCGNALKEKELFCSKCGTKYEEKSPALIKGEEPKIALKEKENAQNIETKEEIKAKKPLDIEKDKSDSEVKNETKGNTEVKDKVEAKEVVAVKNIPIEKETKNLNNISSLKENSFEVKGKLCPKCGNRVEVNAKKCNNCGFKFKKKNKWPLIIFIVFLLILLISYLIIAYQNSLFPFKKDNEPKSEEIILLMPNLVGTTLKEAEGKLDKMGLDVIVEYQETDDEALIGKVFEQSIEEKEKVRKGDIVTLKVYDLKGNLRMISVIGLTKAEAQTKLENMGLKVIIKEDYSDSVTKGLVISQDIMENEEIKEKDQVTITVSLGKKTPVVNNNQTGNNNAGGSSGSTGHNNNQTTPSVNQNQGSSTGNQNQSGSSGNQNPAPSVNKNWSNWVTSLPSGVNYSKYFIETKTEYRSRTKEEKTSTVTNKMDGWTYVRKEEIAGKEINYNTTYSSYERDIKNNPKYQVLSIEKNNQYEIRTAHCDKNDGTSSIPLDSSLNCPSGYKKHSGPSHANLSGNAQVGAVYNGFSGSYVCTKTGKAVSNKIISSIERYNVIAKTNETTYYFERWSNWSEWTTSYILKTSKNEVQTRTLYRYKLK